MPVAVRAASRLVAPGGWLGLMTTEGELDRLDAGDGFVARAVHPLRGSDHRVLALVKRGEI